MDSLNKIRDEHRDAAKQAIAVLESRLQRAKENRDRLVAALADNTNVINLSEITINAVREMQDAGPNMSSYWTARDRAGDLYKMATKRRPDIETSLRDASNEVHVLEQKLNTVRHFLDWGSEG